MFPDPRGMLLQVLPKGGVGVEIGVLMGDFSAQLLQATQPKKLYLVDPWMHFDDAAHTTTLYGGSAFTREEVEGRYPRVVERFREQTQAGLVEIIRDFSTKWAGQVGDGTLDYVYVDGDHNKDAVAADIDAFWPKLKLGGIMAFDDYTLAGWWKDGVVAPVHALLGRERCQLELAVGSQVAVRKL